MVKKLSSTSYNQVIFALCSAISGFFIGGLVFGSNTETKLVYDFVEVEKIVTVEKVVTVEKEVLTAKTENIIADKLIVKETKSPEGTLLLQYEYYNLGVNRQENTKVNESYEEKTKETSKETTTKETSTTVTYSYKNSLGFSFIYQFNSLSFDYKKDWIITYDRYLPPFYGRVIAGPKYIGLGVGFNF